MNLPTRGSVAFFVALIRKKHSPSHHIRAAAKPRTVPGDPISASLQPDHQLEDMNMTFFKDLDTIMKQDFGNRGLLKALPDNPIRETLETLSTARRVILLTGFPVRLEDGTYVGETDGPLGHRRYRRRPDSTRRLRPRDHRRTRLLHRERRRLLPRT